MEKILIIGQGNIGTFLGAAFDAAQVEVTHFVRDKATKRQTLQLAINDMRATEHKVKKGTIYAYSLTDDLTKISEFAYIFVPVEHWQWLGVFEMLKPVLQPHQTLVLCGNIWNEFHLIEENITTPYLFAFPNFGGAVVNNTLEGWLTPNFTLGITNPHFSAQLTKVSDLLTHIGFKPRKENNIKGWLLTHFAYSAATLAEAAKQNGYQVMSKSWASLSKMYRLMRECMEVVKALGIDTLAFAEGKTATQPIWWNVLKTYLIFLMPTVAKGADANKNIEKWMSYIQKIKSTAEKLGVKETLLNEY